MLILTLDLSSRVGFALGRAGEAPQHGIWILDGTLGARYSSLAAQLEDALAVMAPDLVVMEAPLPPQAQTAMASARAQFGLAAVTEMICHERSVPIEEAEAWRVRKLLLGKPRAGKHEVIGWCQAQGWAPVEDNDADAMALLAYRHRLATPARSVTLFGEMRATGRRVA